jgi:tRNA threonylcarbamoyl adenosine modification protein (Sua5/YciO/YrdC/YwlC family)
LNNRAVERVCRLKGLNPAKQRLAIVCPDISSASEYARIDNEAFRIMRANLPGPFTFILPATPRLSKEFKKRREVGVRVPDNDIARELARSLGNPLLTTSIEWEDADPDDLCLPEAISLHYEATVDAIIDGGQGQSTPSAIIDLTDSASPMILREGIQELTL